MTSRPELSRREYLRLLKTARIMKRERTYFLIKTICSTGVRVQQLPQVTVEAVEAGTAVVTGQLQKSDSAHSAGAAERAAGLCEKAGESVPVRSL